MIYKLKKNRVLRAYHGGKRLDKFTGESCCVNTRYPEEWVASVTRAKNDGENNKKAGLSYCENGKLLFDVINENPEAVLGHSNYVKFDGKLPVLVKILDANERLFIQCHPTVEFAKKYFNSQFGKTECWYILEADENAVVYLGFKKGITKEKWMQLFKKQDIDAMLNCMHKLSVKSGDVIFVDGGMPHAIGGSCMLIEVQEPTDLMVIPERKSKDNIVLSDTKMHGGLGFDKMFDCFIYEGYDEEEIKKRYVKHFSVQDNRISNVIGKDFTDKFTMDYVSLDSKLLLEMNDSFRVMIVIDGSCEMKNSEQTLNVKKGDELFISAATDPIELSGRAEMVVCY